jgi:hypothetical protein
MFHEAVFFIALQHGQEITDLIHCNGSCAGL